jgi:SAM-dependent methyltransferase
MVDTIEKYFSGEQLYGDDFTLDQIAEWYAAEEEGYANLGNVSNVERPYEYHEMNKLYGFEKIPASQKSMSALGIGSSFGHEFHPILDKLSQITIIEPSEQLRSELIGHIKPTYVKPAVSGALPFPDNSFDLVTCFGTLHHIPNVSFVVSELNRVTRSGGFVLIREPISTMGDWRKERPGLTKNERGLPIHYLDKLFSNFKFKIVSKSFCDTGFLTKLIAFGLGVGRSRSFYRVDRFVSKIISFNQVYHRDSLISKISPGSAFYVLKK